MSPSQPKPGSDWREQVELQLKGGGHLPGASEVVDIRHKVLSCTASRKKDKALVRGELDVFVYYRFAGSERIRGQGAKIPWHTEVPLPDHVQGSLGVEVSDIKHEHSFNSSSEQLDHTIHVVFNIWSLEHVTKQSLPPGQRTAKPQPPYLEAAAKKQPTLPAQGKRFSNSPRTTNNDEQLPAEPNTLSEMPAWAQEAALEMARKQHPVVEETTKQRFPATDNVPDWVRNVDDQVSRVPMTSDVNDAKVLNRRSYTTDDENNAEAPARRSQASSEVPDWVREAEAAANRFNVASSKNGADNQGRHTYRPVDRNDAETSRRQQRATSDVPDWVGDGVGKTSQPSLGQAKGEFRREGQPYEGPPPDWPRGLSFAFVEKTLEGEPTDERVLSRQTDEVSSNSETETMQNTSAARDPSLQGLPAQQREAQPLSWDNTDQGESAEIQQDTAVNDQQNQVAEEAQENQAAIVDEVNAESPEQEAEAANATPPFAVVEDALQPVAEAVEAAEAIEAAEAVGAAEVSGQIQNLDPVNEPAETQAESQVNTICDIAPQANEVIGAAGTGDATTAPSVEVVSTPASVPVIPAATAELSIEHPQVKAAPKEPKQPKEQQEEKTYEPIVWRPFPKTDLPRF